MGILALTADERVLDVRVSKDTLSVDLRDGRTIAVPLAWYPRLLHATKAQRENWQVAGGGYGIHWPDLDEDRRACGADIPVCRSKRASPGRARPTPGETSGLGPQDQTLMLIEARWPTPRRRGDSTMIQDDQELKVTRERISYLLDLLARLRQSSRPEELGLVTAGTEPKSSACSAKCSTISRIRRARRRQHSATAVDAGAKPW